MIDVCQWRANIGLWNYCQAASSRPANGRHSHSFKAAVDSKSGSTTSGEKTSKLLSALFFIVAFLLLSLSLLRHIRILPTGNCYQIQCTTSVTVTDTNYLQSVVLPGGSSSNLIYNDLYLIVCLRMLLLLSGDVELNPGPMIDDQPDIVLLLQWLEPLVDWQSFGLLLPGITQWTIKTIKQLDAKHQKLALCTKWLNTNPTATWRDVFNALIKRKELRCTGGIQMEETEKLKAKIVERDFVIAKLMKKKLQMSEELQSMKHQNSYSVVSDLLKEIEKLKADITMLTEEKSQLEEKNENLTEENEKLKAKVVDNETYIATLTEEKTLTNEENKKLKIQVSELMDKESQLNKKLQSMEEKMTDNAEKKLQLEKELQSMKNTTTAEDIKQLVKEVGIQFDGILSLIPKEIAEIKAILIGVLQQKQLQPDETDATNKMSHALSIDVVVPSVVVPSVVAATSTERVRAEVIPEVAYRVVSECISELKHCGIDLHFLAEKLLEKKIINNRHKKKAIDEYSGRTTDQRMDQLLDIIKDSVQQEGKVFEYILEILKDEDTILANKLYEDMINKYEQKKKQYKQYK
uniref:CARD domain-containing protein n=1 Tax=Amphimedon queenslandica TaxID=400682 RepID=A0A1X7TF39_AMPQE